MNKTYKYKLGSSLKIHFTFFYPKDVQNVFWKTIGCVEILEMKQIAEDWGVEKWVQKSMCYSPLGIKYWSKGWL